MILTKSFYGSRDQVKNQVNKELRPVTFEIIDIEEDRGMRSRGESGWWLVTIDTDETIPEWDEL